MLNRSKSAVAIPALSGVSIGRGGMLEQVAAIEAAEAHTTKVDSGRGKVCFACSA